MGQRREVPHLQVLLPRDVVGRTDRREHLRLLDGVDPEVRLEIQVHVQHVGRVPGLLGDDLENLRPDRVRGGGRSCRGRRVGRHGFLEFWLAVVDELHDMGQRREVPHLQVLLPRDVVGRTDRREHLRLLDGVDPEVRLEIQVHVQHVGRVPGLLSDDLHDIFLDRILRGGSRCSRDRRRSGQSCRGRSGRRRGACRLGLPAVGLQSGERGRAVFYPRGRPLVFDPQRSLHNLDFRGFVPGQPLQPRIPGAWVFDTVPVPEIRRGRPGPVRSRLPPQERHADLRTEPRTQPQYVPHRVGPALGQVQRAEFRVHLLEVGDRRHYPGFQDLGRYDILDPHGHGMPGRPLGVGDQDPAGIVPEYMAQGEDFRRRTPAARRGIGLMGNENGLGNNRAPFDPPLGLGFGDQPFHDVADMRDVEPGSVEGAVGHDGIQNSAEGPDPALPRRLPAFEHDGRSPHPDDQAVPPAVERRGRVLDDIVGRGTAGGEETRTEPSHQVFRRDVVGGNDDDALAPPHPDPVMGQPEGLRTARTRAVGGCVRPACPDVLGELRVAHRQDAEQEAAVELVGIGVYVLAQRIHPLPDVPSDAVDRPFGCFIEGLELFEALALDAVPVIPLDDLGQGIVPRESGREQNPGVVPDGVGKHPPVGQLRPLRRRLVAHDQRNAGIAERVDPGGDRELRHAVKCGDAVFRESKFAPDVEIPGAGGKFDDIVEAVDRLKTPLPGLGLDQARDVLVHHRLPKMHRDLPDESVPSQDPLDIGVVENLRGSGQAEGGTRDADFDRGCGCGAASAGVDLQPPFHEFGEEPPEFRIAVRSRGGCGAARRRFGAARGKRRQRGRGRRDRSPVPLRLRSRSHGRFLRGYSWGRLPVRRPESQAGSIQAAEGEVERFRLTDPGVVREQGDHVLAVAQHVLDEPVQDAFGADFDKNAGAGVVERVEPLDELHGGGHLPAQQLDHLRHDSGAHGIEFACHVRHDRDLGRIQAHPAEDHRQGFPGGRHDPGMESVAHLQRAHGEACRADGLHGFFHTVGGSSDDGFLRTVDVGNDDIVAHPVEYFLDLFDRPERGRHHSVVLERAPGHLFAARADGLQRLVEGDGPRGNQRSVFAQAVPHDHVGHHPVGAEHVQDRVLRRQDGGLGDGRLLQVLFGLPERGLVGFVEVDAFGQRPAEQRRHGAVRFLEHPGNDRLGLPELLEHVDVLGPLPREEKRRLGRRAGTPVDAFRPQRFPPARLVLPEGLQGAVGLVSQLRRISVVDGDAERSPQIGLQGRGGGRGDAGRGLLLERLEAPDQFGFRTGPQDGGAAQRCLQPGIGVPARDRHNRLPLAGDFSGNVLLHHHVEIGPAESEGADGRPARFAFRNIPRPQLGIDPERRLGKIDDGIRLAEIEARRQDFLVEGQCRLDDSRRAGGALEMPDIRLDRPQSDGAHGQVVVFEKLHEAFELARIPDRSRGAVPLDQVAGLGDEARFRPGAPDTEDLPDGIRRRNALPPAVAGSSHPTDDGINLVPVAFGVLEPLEEDDGPAFPHHETVGPIGVGPRAGCGERAELAELHKGRGAHVGIDAAGKNGVVIMVVQADDGGADGGHCGGAGCIGGVVRPFKIEQGRDAPGEDVRQFARHRVFRYGRKPFVEVLPELVHDLPADVRRERGIASGAGQLVDELGQKDSGCRIQVRVPPHGVAQNNGDPFRVQGTGRIAVVVQGLPRRHNAPFLGKIHGHADLRRYRQAPFQGIPFPVAHPASDLGVGFVERLRVRIVVESRVPSVGRHLGDAVPAVLDVLPELRSVGSIRHYGAYAYDRNSLLCRRYVHYFSASRLHRLQ